MFTQNHILIESAAVAVEADVDERDMASSPSSAMSSKDAEPAHSPASATTVSIAESSSASAGAHQASSSGNVEDEPVPDLVAESEGSDEDDIDADEDEDDAEFEMQADMDDHDHQQQFHELALQPEAELIYSTCKTLYVMLRADPGALTIAAWKLGLFLQTPSAVAAAARAKATMAVAGHATASSETKQLRGLDCMLELIRRGHSTPETQFGPHCALTEHFHVLGVWLFSLHASLKTLTLFSRNIHNSQMFFSRAQIAFSARFLVVVLRVPPSSPSCFPSHARAVL